MKNFLKGFILGVLTVFGMVLMGTIIVTIIDFSFSLFGGFWGLIVSSALTVGFILGIAIHVREEY